MEPSSTTNSQYSQESKTPFSQSFEATQKTQVPHEENSLPQLIKNHSKGMPYKEMLLTDPSMEREFSGCQKLKRNEVAGNILIPERWGQEGFLKEWMDYSSFDALLAPKGIVSAREALVAEARRGLKKDLGC